MVAISSDSEPIPTLAHLSGMDTSAHHYEVAGFRIVLRPDPSGGYQWSATHRQRHVSSNGYQNSLSSALEEAKSFARNN